ncbi:MAG: protein kinase family protein [Planctomycetes bacterium]|nr:protein kinase family protein [Planctomycetota bacterium]
MPAWPTQSDYKDSLQNPDTAFREPDLKLSQAERSPMGVPRARSGAFASVYKMTGPKGVVALKLFNFPNDDRARRYKAVSDYLEKDLGPKKPPCVVKFQYHGEGIRVGKGWYPTLTMAWVKGVSLGEWVRQTVERKVPDVAAVKRMAEQWVALVQQLQEFKIAHGDLQHDNVMVVADAPVLVDYDGMCVPSLDPADPKKKLDQLEFGKPAYQHPGRAVEKLSANLDHFAAWVILIALRAIAADPQLYKNYVLKTDNENLLFTQQDMQEPAGSKLWPDLMKCKDPEVSEWARTLRLSLDRPYAKIPPFTLDPFDRLRKLVSASPRDWPAIEGETERLKKAGKPVPADLADKVNPVGGLKELCAAPRKDWPAILSEGDRLVSTGKPLTPDVARVVEDARKRVAARDGVKKASGDPRALVAAYKPELIDDWADAALVSGARAAAAQVAILDKLKLAVATPGDGAALVKLWDEAAPKLSSVSEAAKYQQAAEGWRARLRAANEFARAFERPTATERELADAWKAVAAAGPPHPSVTAAHRARGEQATRWAPLIDALKRVPTTAGYDGDKAIVAAWGGGAALAGCREAAPFATRAADAAARLELVAALERAIKLAETGGPEDAVVLAAAKLPAGYAHPFATRVGEGSEAIKLMGDIQKALAPEFPSDRKVATYYDRLKAKNPKLAKRLQKVNPALFAEAEACTARRALLDQFVRIDRNEPRADKQDEKWLALWAEHGEELSKRRDREELRARLTLARDRTKAWGKLSEALAARDMFTLRKRHRESAELLADYPPLVERTGEIQGLLAKADRVVGVQERFARAGNLDPADLAFLRENHEAFSAEMKRAIEKTVRARLAGDARLVAAYPAYHITGTRGGLVKACWAWGGHGLISYCVVGVDARRFLADPSEADPYSRLKCLSENYQREGGGITVVPPAGAQQAYVTIWPVVELGWTTVLGPALTVGPVPLAANVKQW